MSEIKMTPSRILRLGCLYLAAVGAALVILSVLGCAKAEASGERFYVRYVGGVRCIVFDGYKQGGISCDFTRPVSNSR